MDSRKSDKVLGIIENRRKDVSKNLQCLVATPSVNPNFSEGEGEKEISEIIKEQLKDIGLIDVQVLEKVKGRPNVIGTIKGSTRRPVLMFNAHTDTVGIDRRHLWEDDPFSGIEKEGEIYGLGSCDMKGAISSILFAAQSILDTGVKLEGDLKLVFSADEEYGGSLGMKWLMEERGVGADAAIVTEPSSIKKPLDYIHIALRGTSDFQVKVYGEPMHTGLADIEKPVNAAEKMKNKLKLRYSGLSYGLGPSVNLGVTVNGGQHQWSVPGECVFGVDVRIIPGMTPEGVVDEVREFLNGLMREDPSLKVELESSHDLAGAMMPAEISPEEPIVKHVLEASKIVLNGNSPKLGCFPGGDDARFMINDFRIPTIASFGPGFLKYAHAPNERVSIDEVVNVAKIYALTSMSFLGLQ